jgi:hypothetical protein
MPAAANQNLPLIQQNYQVPITAGRTYPITGLGTGSMQVLASDGQRQQVTFHNPNNGDGTNGVTCWVCQSTDAVGNALPAAPNGAGTFTIFPGASQTFFGNMAKSAWNACAASAGQNLTAAVDP